MDQHTKNQKTTADWIDTNERFVLFIDILGFKNLVNSTDHLEILKKLSILKETISKLEKLGRTKRYANFDSDQSKAVVFSDSIIFFSKGSSENDAQKISMDAYRILQTALKNEIPLKGCIAFGLTTADFKNSLFFGKPIISAYELHDDLEMQTIILDNKAEQKILEFSNEENLFNEIYKKYKAKLKSGRINHYLIYPIGDVKAEQIINLEKQYNNVCGKPRVYIDNTLEYLETTNE